MAADTRERILDAAAELLVSGGTDGVSTRAVAAAAGVQAPTLYRLFGDKQGLLEAASFERWDTLRKFRNSTAHPEMQTLFMPTHALTFLTNVAGDINALFN